MEDNRYLRVVAKSKRVKAFFGLLFPLMYFPFPIYYYSKYPERWNLDLVGSIILVSFFVVIILYYKINGLGFIKSLFSKNVVSIRSNDNYLIIFDKIFAESNHWTDISLKKKFGLDFIIIKNGKSVIGEIYGNCANLKLLKKKRIKNSVLHA